MSDNYETSFQLAPGESNVAGVKVSPSLLTAYIKGELMCSSTRFVYKIPNTVLGVIPLGSEENTIPLKSIASVNTATKFHIGRFIFGIVLAIAGFSSITSSFVIGLIMMALGAVLLAMTFPAQLRVVNHAGGVNAVTVSILEKSKLEKFAREFQNRVFADLEQTRHDEAQTMRMMQTQLAQMQVQNQQQMMNNQNNTEKE
ncbi:hypothetical protein HCQ94_02060 [Actinomyces sp. zg-332]|uniref:hypothetical protein n=1 Tax=Actinomyces sp. zg-332 TaxID=2708340 RepID=UPI00141F28AC|nr:hypothetical protein [Actinomyces sp. zg-332]QPK94510.1 hypothetical protein HCQ94_02060 [Actinomyces sp. zg-332]